LGSEARAVRGFSSAPGAETGDMAKAVRDFFPPELFNRIDRVVAFQPLDRTTAKGIVRKELARLVARPGISERSTFVRFTEAVVERVVEAGYSAEYGARALKRYIDRELGDRLTHAIVDEPRAEMRMLWLHLDGREGVGVRAESLVEAEPHRAPSAME